MSSAIRLLLTTCYVLLEYCLLLLTCAVLVRVLGDEVDLPHAASNKGFGLLPYTILQEKRTRSTASYYYLLLTSCHLLLAGETDEEHRELVELVKSLHFERGGAFVYSPEDGT